jgi:uncharacterized protein YfaS (alpha-2-macroglobulin family)
MSATEIPRTERETTMTELATKLSPDGLCWRAGKHGNGKKQQHSARASFVFHLSDFELSRDVASARCYGRQGIRCP